MPQHGRESLELLYYKRHYLFEGFQQYGWGNEQSVMPARHVNSGLHTVTVTGGAPTFSHALHKDAATQCARICAQRAPEMRN